MAPLVSAMAPLVSAMAPLVSVMVPLVSVMAALVTADFETFNFVLHLPLQVRSGLPFPIFLQETVFLQGRFF